MTARKIQVTISTIYPQEDRLVFRNEVFEVWSIKMRLHWRSVALTQYCGIAGMVNGDVTEGT